VVRAASTGSAAARRRIYAVVARIPKGTVATYGQVAELAGLPRAARLVGRALRLLPEDTRVPWHRVVNARGRISHRADALGHEELQARLLGREGVRIVGGTISFPRFRWPAGTFR
jgi:methylated-DNA-protein-cysteine methyltransferase-like protein